MDNGSCISLCSLAVSRDDVERVRHFMIHLKSEQCSVFDREIVVVADLLELSSRWELLTNKVLEILRDVDKICH